MFGTQVIFSNSATANKLALCVVRFLGGSLVVEVGHHASAPQTTFASCLPAPILIPSSMRSLPQLCWLISPFNSGQCKRVMEVFLSMYCMICAGIPDSQLCFLHHCCFCLYPVAVHMVFQFALLVGHVLVGSTSRRNVNVGSTRLQEVHDYCKVLFSHLLPWPCW